MDRIDPIQSKGDLQKLQQPSSASPKERMLAAKEAAEKLLKSYPDFDKAPKPYLLSIVEIMAGLSDDVLVAVLDLKTGVRARCSYLPTVADVVKCADEYIKRRDQFRPPVEHSIYKKFSVDEPKCLPDIMGREPLEPHEHRVYSHAKTADRVSMPHKSPGNPWEVKPEGYWTAWAPSKRKAWDDEQVRIAQGGA